MMNEQATDTFREWDHDTFDSDEVVPSPTMASAFGSDAERLAAIERLSAPLPEGEPPF